jgi:Cu(I)/Ag(I) efflux system membrane fusion protein
VEQTNQDVISRISLDSLQQRIAAVGHDTEKYKAADSVYAELPSCCLYRGTEKSH